MKDPEIHPSNQIFGRVRMLNEIEFVPPRSAWINVWQTNAVVRVDIWTGFVERKLNLATWTKKTWRGEVGRDRVCGAESGRLDEKEFWRGEVGLCIGALLSEVVVAMAGGGENSFLWGDRFVSLWTWWGGISLWAWLLQHNRGGISLWTWWPRRPRRIE